MYSSTLSLSLALDGVGGSCHVPGTLPPAMTRYPLYRRLGGPQSCPEWVWKISPLPGFDPRTIQPVVSYYTNYAIPALCILYTLGQNLLVIFNKIQYSENIKSCNDMKPHTQHEKTLQVYLQVFNTCSPHYPVKVLRTVRNFSYLPQHIQADIIYQIYDMLLQLKYSYMQQRHILQELPKTKI
jgi:hypothetical protein